MSGAGRSRRAWGWHRLTDEWAARVVAEARVRPGELVVDVGAGLGALTGPLVAAGARVVAVEAHPGRAELLTARFVGGPVTVVCADIRHFPWPGRPFRVVANPPFVITSTLLRVLLAPDSRLVAADLVLQRAVVRGLAGSTARRWRLHAGMSLPRNAFRPAPRVDSAVLAVRRR